MFFFIFRFLIYLNKRKTNKRLLFHTLNIFLKILISKFQMFINLFVTISIDNVLGIREVREQEIIINYLLLLNIFHSYTFIKLI